MANIGIDLGTTNSLVSVVLGGKARVLLDDDGRPMTPSAVRFVPGQDAPLIGYEALIDAHEHPKELLTSFKRFMGRNMSEAREVVGELPYSLSEDEHRVVRFDVGGERHVTPVEASAWVLRMLLMHANDCLMAAPGGAVITVPAYFDDAQRQATRDAGKLAGINVLRLLNEPTAAAIAYGLQENTKGIYAVYDLGGGTFDVSILELTDGVFQVLSTAGDTQLGGDDFDRVLVEELGLGSARDGELRAAMVRATGIKHALSTADSAQGITRERFDELIRPLVEKTLASCKRAIGDAELELGDIDGVVLVGGSTRVPLVAQMVGEFFGKKPFSDLDPDQVVAMGAAMQADILTGHSELADDLLLMDVVPLSLGVETMGGVVEKLIWRCTPIPCSASETFTTHVDGQTGVDLHVLQGERELTRDCRSLAKFKLSGLPDMPAGLPRVKVEFTVDADGILQVSATEQYTKTHARIDVQPSYGLEDEEIERLLEEALDNAETDVDERLLIEVRVESEQVMNVVEKALRVDAAMLLEGEREIIEDAVAKLVEARAGTDRKLVQTRTEHLDEVTAAFAQRRIERDLKLALEGQDAYQVSDALDRTVSPD
ncbi:MAG: Fe-S protein assembly chaperone HscA [Proteobacteria bacterium]|nr:Fe-S protein assembly chaperone HscA [Pseudomonadota bacterium]MCP4921307.1 Fe-S protein assembly chaperone HscA [Pseudomonadota bacterium]